MMNGRQLFLKLEGRHDAARDMAVSGCFLRMACNRFTFMVLAARRF
jgi:hypothetical protein